MRQHRHEFDCISNGHTAARVATSAISSEAATLAMVNPQSFPACVLLQMIGGKQSGHASRKDRLLIGMLTTETARRLGQVLISVADELEKPSNANAS